MSTRNFRTLALTGLLALPVSGVAFAGVQVLDMGVAGASGTTVCSTGTIDISVNGVSVTVDMSQGSDGHASTGCFDVSGGTNVYDYTIPSSGISGGFVQSLTLNAGVITSDDSTYFVVSDTGTGSTTAVLNQTSFPGCELQDLATDNALALTGSGGAVSGSASEGASIIISNYGSGSCSSADRTYLSGQIAHGVSLSGSLTLA